MKKWILVGTLGMALSISSSAIAADTSEKSPCAKGQVAMWAQNQKTGERQPVCALNKKQAQEMHKAAGTGAFSIIAGCFFNTCAF